MMKKLKSNTLFNHLAPKAKIKKDAHHVSQDRHSSRRQAQLTLRTHHLPDQSAPFNRAST
jgi:hypothetical protein